MSLIYNNEVVSQNNSQPTFGIFGETIVSSLKSYITNTFTYGINTQLDINNNSTGNGNISETDNTIIVTSGISGIGAISSKTRVQYNPGRTTSCKFIIRTGIQPLTIKFVTRNNGNDNPTIVPAPTSIDFTKLNAYEISFGGLIGPAYLTILEPGQNSPRQLIKIENHGSSNEPLMSNPYVPIRLEVSNTYIRIGLFDSDSGIFMEFPLTSGIQLAEIVSWWVGSLTGDQGNPSNRHFHYDLQVGPIAATTVGRFYNLISFRSLGIYKSKPNKIIATLDSLSFMPHTVSNDGPFRLALIRNGTPSSAFLEPNWNEINPNNSVLQYNTQAVEITSVPIQRGSVTSVYATAALGSHPGAYSPGVVESLNKGIYLQPATSDIYTIGAQFLAGTYHVDLSVEWVELF